jgi:hypothetical protein
MTVHFLTIPFAVAVLNVGAAVADAQQPDPADDPLPKGAKVRMASRASVRKRVRIFFWTKKFF